MADNFEHSGILETWGLGTAMSLLSKWIRYLSWQEEDTIAISVLPTGQRQMYSEKKDQAPKPFATKVHVSVEPYTRDATLSSMTVQLTQSSTYESVLKEVCKKLRLDPRHFALLVDPSRQGVKDYEVVSEDRLVMIRRDVCGGSYRLEDSISTWTRDHQEWLIGYIASVTDPGKARYDTFLSFIDKTSPCGTQIVSLVAKVSCMEWTKFVEEFHRPHLGNDTWNTASRTHEAEFRWETLVRELKALLPHVSALQAEKELRKMLKTESEDLKMFVYRYKQRLDDHIREEKIDERLGLEIILNKMPRDFLQGLTTIPYSSMTMDALLEKVDCYCHWIRVCKPLRERVDLGDVLDADAACLHSKSSKKSVNRGTAAAAGVKGKVVENGKINYSEIRTDSHAMIAWKALIRNPRFRQESIEWLGSLDSDGKPSEEPSSDSDTNTEENPVELNAVDKTNDSVKAMHLKVDLSRMSFGRMGGTQSLERSFIQRSLRDLSRLNGLRFSEQRVVYTNGVENKLEGVVKMEVTTSNDSFEISCYCADGDDPGTSTN